MSKNIDKEYLLNNSKVFCMLPWVHMHMSTAGDFRPCCVSVPKHAYGSSDDMSITEAFDSDEIKQLRLNMLNETPSKECANCYSREEDGVASTRQWTTERWSSTHFHRVENTHDDGSINETTMPYLDLRFSNKCNLRCMMCSPHSSSSWRGDAIKLWDMSGADVDRITNTRKKERTSDEIKHMLDNSLDDLEEVYFAGGEPMMMEEHWQTLNHLISIGKTDIIVRYSTNFTKLVYGGQHIFDLWKKFKEVNIGLSLDGYGERGEYIRNGIKWDTMVSNIKSLRALIKEYPHIHYKFDCAVNIFNIYHIVDLHRYLMDTGLGNERQLHFITVIHPHHLRTQVLNDELKHECEVKIRKHIEYLKTIKYDWEPDGFLDYVIEKYENVIRYMNASDLHEKEYGNFINYVTKVDAIRNLSYLDVCPELGKMIPDE